jgi:hypothetical protein
MKSWNSLNPSFQISPADDAKLRNIAFIEVASKFQIFYAMRKITLVFLKTSNFLIQSMKKYVFRFDVMHDFLEGVLHYGIFLIFQPFIFKSKQKESIEMIETTRLTTSKPKLNFSPSERTPLPIGDAIKKFYLSQAQGVKSLYKSSDGQMKE